MPLGNGQTYTTSGTHTNVTTNAAGCPHTETLDLTINYSTSHTTTATACDSYTWAGPLGNGQTYTTSGTHTNVTTNAAGCPHTETLDLTINYSTSHTTTATACDSYTWAGPLGNGQTYITSGTHTNVTTNAAGCPHTETLDLTINKSTSHTTTIKQCAGSYTWAGPLGNGQTYTTSGTHTNVTTNAAGCPHTETLDLTINPLPTVYAGADFTKTCILNPVGKQIGETPVAGFTYSWLPTTGLSNAAIANPIANPSVTTIYTLTKTNTATGCKKTDAVCVTVNIARPANPYVTQTAPTCTVSTGTVTVTSPVGADYQYSNNGGTYQTSPVFVLPAGSAYSILVRRISNGCVSLSAKTGTIAAQPKTPTASITCGVQKCTGSVASFSLTAVTNGVSFAWSKSAGADGSFSTTTGSPTIYTPGPNDMIKGVTITLTAKSADGCYKAATFKLNPVPCGAPYYTYTQGYYSSTGSSCTPLGGVKGAVALIQYSLDNRDGILGNSAGQLYLGRSGASFTVNYADAAKLVAIMPGGGTANRLFLNHNLTAAANYPPLNNGKIYNILLSQSVTLGLNTSIPGNGLKNFVLKTGYLTTITRAGSSCTAGAASCATGGTLSSLKITSNTTLMNLLSNQTVDSLYRMASKALGGTLPTGVGYSDISGAVDVINRSFDGGRFVIGYYATAQSCSAQLYVRPANPANQEQLLEVTKLTVAAYPNPFTDRVKFNIVSPVSGKASLDVYNIMGQKLKTVYQGYLFAGRGQVIEYNVPSATKGGLIYTLRIGDQQVNGKLIQLK